ncbi:hypothetical protein [Virgibacillus halodenitrificans]|uniref:hypothetical protein n=1 Tax=Virgibacillus halodenitrificans TaxID=1482 RepID=UPI0013CF36B3|nr:hypothetical protein [Virgibacillus halodenitrificans]
MSEENYDWDLSEEKIKRIAKRYGLEVLNGKESGLYVEGEKVTIHDLFNEIFNENK